MLEGPLVFVDIETNGLSHIKGRVIEVAAIRVEDGQITDSIDQLIDPETELPAFITGLTGITGADLKDAPLFNAIADKLYGLIDGAVFVAHNVRFDYAFLKQEFKRLGREFRPKQLCTMRLSRTLYPQERSHKLQSLITRYGFEVHRRHRAYDDAAVLWDFIKHTQQHFDPETLQAALAKQLRQPSLPKGLAPEILAGLPDTPGVYVFEDDKGYPLYVGKSVHIKQRVMSHFTSDHEHVSEFKIAQHIHNIRVHETAGELSALLLESRLVKELQPLYNKQLRRTQKLLVAKTQPNDNGYLQVVLEEADEIDPAGDSILGVYATRGKARSAIERLVKDFMLCPKLTGAEKGKGPCFMRQLHKCLGACAGKEPVSVYNQRLLEAFARKRIQDWPFSSPIIITEGDATDARTGIIVDQWRVIGHLQQEPYCEPTFTVQQGSFDMDSYKILQAHLAAHGNALNFRPISHEQLQTLLTT